MKMFHIGTMEGVSRVIRPRLCKFICDQQLHFRHHLEYNSHSPFVFILILWMSPIRD